MAKGVPAQIGKDKAKTKEVVAQAHDLIAEHYLDLTQALIDKAVGLRFQDEKGNVYTKEPDTTALIRAIEILGGKPVARVETSEAGGFSEYEEWIKAQVGAGAVQSVPAPPEAAVKVLAAPSSPHPDMMRWLDDLVDSPATPPPASFVPPSGWKQMPRMKEAVDRFFWEDEGPPLFDPVPPSVPPPPASPRPPSADVAGAVGVEGAGPPGESPMDNLFKDIGLDL